MKIIVATAVGVLMSLSGPAFGQAFTDHETTAANETGTPGATNQTRHGNAASSHQHDTVADPTGVGNSSATGVTNNKAGKEIFAGSAARSGSGVQPK